MQPGDMVRFTTEGLLFSKESPQYEDIVWRLGLLISRRFNMVEILADGDVVTVPVGQTQKAGKKDFRDVENDNGM
jgi:predicted SnoaL-like aldol condensation-catalyzing enzyme